MVRRRRHADGARDARQGAADARVPEAARVADRGVGEPPRQPATAAGGRPRWSTALEAYGVPGYEVRAYENAPDALFDAARGHREVARARPPARLARRPHLGDDRLPRGRGPARLRRREGHRHLHPRPVVPARLVDLGPVRPARHVPGPAPRCAATTCPGSGPRAIYPDRDGLFIAVVPTEAAAAVGSDRRRSRRPPARRLPERAAGHRERASACEPRVRDDATPPGREPERDRDDPDGPTSASVAATVTANPASERQHAAAACCGSRTGRARGGGRSRRTGPRARTPRAPSPSAGRPRRRTRRRRAAPRSRAARRSTSADRRDDAQRADDRDGAPPDLVPRTRRGRRRAQAADRAGNAASEIETPISATGTLWKLRAKLTAETLPATRVEATLVKNRNVSGSIGWLTILGTISRRNSWRAGIRRSSRRRTRDGRPSGSRRRGCRGGGRRRSRPRRRPP